MRVALSDFRVTGKNLCGSVVSEFASEWIVRQKEHKLNNKINSTIE